MVQTGMGAGVYLFKPTCKQKIAQDVLDSLCYIAKVSCIGMHPAYLDSLHNVLGCTTRVDMIRKLTVENDILNKKGIKQCSEFKQLVKYVTDDSLYAECVLDGIFFASTTTTTTTHATLSS